MSLAVSERLHTQFLEVVSRARTDFPWCAERYLKIKTKEERIQGLAFNPVQTTLHQIIEARHTAGQQAWFLILKARQMGCSTYCEARKYHRVSFFPNRTGLVVAHKLESTEKLFGMMTFMYDHMEPMLKPARRYSSKKELTFEDEQNPAMSLNSKLMVETAGGKQAGHSLTLQEFHGSEVAYWEDPLTLLGILNACTDKSEVILETTANGPQGTFFELWQEAEAGRNQYVPVFFPWFDDPSYRSTQGEADRLGALSDEERQLRDKHGCDLKQLAWRRWAIANKCLGEVKLFRQQYPATAEEAFWATADPMVAIPPEWVHACLGTPVAWPVRACVIAGDPARYGDDESVIYAIKGHQKIAEDVAKGTSTMETAGKMRIMKRQQDADAIAVDGIGIGAGLVDRLEELGEKVFDLVSSETADEPERFANRRAEMWFHARELFRQQQVSLDPADKALAQQLSSVQYKVRSDGTILMEAKEEVRKRLSGRSPDRAEAFIYGLWAEDQLAQQGRPSRMKETTHLYAGGRGGW